MQQTKYTRIPVDIFKTFTQGRRICYQADITNNQMHEYTPIVSSLFDECTLLLEEGGRERKGRYGNNSRTGVAVSEEMKEGAVRSGRAWSERGRKDREGGGMKERYR